MVHRLLLVLLLAWPTLAAADDPPPQPDPPAVQAAFDAGFDAMARGDYATAAAQFEVVAAGSNDPARRRSATEMAARARSMIGTAPPGTKPAENEEIKGGRTLFLSSTTVYALNYGWLVPLTLDIEDPGAFVGVYLLTAGAGFVVPYFLTQDMTVSNGAAMLSFGGMFMGMAHATLLGMAIDGGDYFDEHPRVLTGSLVFGSVLEGAIGFKYAHGRNLTVAQSSAITSGGLYGMGVGLGAGVLLQFHEMDDEESGGRAFAAAALVGSAAGLAAGKWYGDSRKLTWGESSVMQLGIPLGIGVGALPLIYSDGDMSEELAVSLLLAGFGAGAIAGDRIVAMRQFTKEEGNIVGLETLAGLLIADGLYFIFNQDLESDDGVKGFYTTTVGGAIAGYLIGCFTQGSARVAATAAAPGAPAADTGAPPLLLPTVTADGSPGLAMSFTF